MKPAWRLRSWQFITAQSLVGLVAVGTWSQAQEQASTNAASTAPVSSQTGPISQPSQPKQPTRLAKKSGNTKTASPSIGQSTPAVPSNPTRFVNPPAKSVFRFDLLSTEPARTAIVIPENIPNRTGLVSPTETPNQPVQNTPVQNTPVQNTPVQNTPVQNTPVQNTPVPNTPVPNTPVPNSADPAVIPAADPKPSLTTPAVAGSSAAQSETPAVSGSIQPIARTADASVPNAPASSSVLRLTPPSGETESARALSSETRIASASESPLPLPSGEPAPASTMPEAPPLDPPSLPPLLPTQNSTSNDASEPSSIAPPRLLSPKDQTPQPAEQLDPQTRLQLEQQQERVRIAKLISQQNLSSAQPSSGMPSVPSIEAPPGWQAIEQKLRERLQNCELMLRRNALYSARQESLRALHELCQMLDLRDPGLRRDAALSLAVLALKEEEDFHRSAMLGSGSGMDVKQLVTSHQTPVLKSLDASSIAPLLAAQHYRAFARSQFVIAADQHPWAADLLYAHGKALESLAKEHPNKSLFYNQQAEVLYEAALETNPKQAVAATQLGFVLLQLDRADEARQVLLHGTTTGPTIQTWENLAESFRRVGDGQGIEWARQNYAQTAARNPPRDPRIPEQHEHLDPATFAAISPRYDWMPRMDQNPNNIPPNFAQQGGAMNMLPPNATYPVAAPRNQVQPQTQTARSGWISGFFR